MPPKDAILFIGSSSFRLWKGMKQAFPEHQIINRAFGGSTLPEVIHYADDIIFPYQPDQIVIYCGDNDLASSDTVTPEIVFERYKELTGLIRSKLPNVNLVYVAIKPSPSRLKLMPKMKKANDLIAEYLKKDKNASFIDVYSPMLTKNGTPMGSLFKADSLHMNESGYAIWQKLINPKLLKNK